MTNFFEVAWFGSHNGEEPPISGERGSGTVFFCRCNLKCVYCQNWQISQNNIAVRKVTADELYEIFFRLQENGCHNINLVTPVVWSFHLRKVIKKAKNNGLKIPVVWNTNAYETVSSLRHLEGLIDIYLPDYKYSDDFLAKRYSNAPGYVSLAQSAIVEMQRQVGDLVFARDNTAVRGLAVRHLVLPGLLKNTYNCLKFIRSLSPNIHLSLLAQYNPVYRSKDYSEINRSLNKEEYDQVLEYVEEFKFGNGWIQEFDGSVKCFTPDFTKENPFTEQDGKITRQQ